MRKFKSPFKDKALLIYEINKFLDRHQATVCNQASKISHYFEMSIYNSVVTFYERRGYKVSCSRLFDGKFKYKLSPTGHPQNFSYFIAEKTYKYGKSKVKKFTFQIHHNVAVESGIEKGLFITPDVSVVSPDAFFQLKDRKYFFSGNRAYHYVENSKLQTFFEAKNLNPFPELVFNFIGLLNELKNDIFRLEASNKRPMHLAPSLMTSGGGNYHMRRIRKSLMGRYKINIFYGMFYRSAQPYSKYYDSLIQKIGTK